MEETKRCPYCGEEILATAKKCRYCGEWLDKEPAEKGTYSSDDVPKQNGNPYLKDNERKGNGLIILILSISIAIVIAIGGFIFLSKQMKKVNDAEKVTDSIVNKSVTNSSDAIHNADYTNLLDHVTYTRYYNNRFGFTVSYPSCFEKGEEPENGDGCNFTLGKDIKLTVSGIWWQDMTLASGLDGIDIHKVAYYRHKGNWIAVSDYMPNGDIFYKKVVLRNDTLMTAMLTFPAEYKDQFDPIIKQIFNNFPN
jgi:hypothetical protein